MIADLLLCITQQGSSSLKCLVNFQLISGLQIREMKRGMILLLAVLITGSLAAQERALIFGKINFGQSTLMQLSWLEDVMLQKKGQLQADVNPEGEFFLPVPCDKLTRYELYYSGQSIPVYLEPGDKVEMNFNAGSMHMAKFAGKGSEKTQLAGQLNRIYPFERAAQHVQTPHFSFGQGRNQAEMVEKLSFASYVKETDRRKEKKLAAFDTLKNTASEDFANYLEMEIRAKWGGDIMMYLNKHPDVSIDESIATSSQVYSELSPYAEMDAVYLENAGYIRFLAAFINHYNLRLPREMQRNLDEYYALTEQHLTGGGRELIQAKILANQLKRRNMGFFDSKIQFLEANMQHRWILDELVSLGAEVNSFATGAPAEDFELMSNDSVLYKLSNEKGKVQFLSFWATWCAPCLQNFERNKSEKKALAEQGISFVNIAIKNEHDEWMAELESNTNISGINLLADKEMSEKLQRDYRFSGLPHYVIIDKEGKLVFLKNQNKGSLEKLKSELLQLAQ